MLILYKAKDWKDPILAEAKSFRIENKTQIWFSYIEINGSIQTGMIDCKDAKKAKVFFEEIVDNATKGNTIGYDEAKRDLYFIIKNARTKMQKDFEESFDDFFKKYFGSTHTK